MFLEADCSGEIDKEELLALLENDTAEGTLQQLSIDMVFVVNYLMMFYEDPDSLTIKFIMQTMLSLRGDCIPTVQDSIDEQTYMLWVLAKQLGQGVMSIKATMIESKS